MGKRGQLFRQGLGSLSARHSEIWRNYEILYHVNDFLAGLLFVVGSVLFFWGSTQRLATWMFLVGSILFTLRPGIRLTRDLHLTRLSPDDEERTGRSDGIQPQPSRLAGSAGDRPR